MSSAISPSKRQRVESNLGSFKNFPQDAIQKIFSFLSTSNIFKSARTSSEWNRYISSPLIFSILAQRTGHLPKTDIPRDLSLTSQRQLEVTNFIFARNFKEKITDSIEKQTRHESDMTMRGASHALSPKGVALYLHTDSDYREAIRMAKPTSTESISIITPLEAGRTITSFGCSQRSDRFWAITQFASTHTIVVFDLFDENYQAFYHFPEADEDSSPPICTLSWDEKSIIVYENSLNRLGYINLEAAEFEISQSEDLEGIYMMQENSLGHLFSLSSDQTLYLRHKDELPSFQIAGGVQNFCLGEIGERSLIFAARANGELTVMPMGASETTFQLFPPTCSINSMNYTDRFSLLFISSRLPEAPLNISFFHVELEPSLNVIPLTSVGLPPQISSATYLNQTLALTSIGLPGFAPPTLQLIPLEQEEQKSE